MSTVEIDLLRKMPIFGGLSPASLESLLGEAETIAIKRGEYFFREGDPGDALFVLREGAVEIERRWKDQTVTLGNLARGDCFGEMALVDFRPRSASARATQDSAAMRISLSALRSLLRNDIEQYAMIMMNMGREVSRRLRTAGDRILELQSQVNASKVV